MQRCIIFFLFLIIGWKASLFAQEKITVDAENRSVGELFLQIEKQSGYTFSYNPSLLKDFPPVTIKIVDGSLERVLDLLFNRTDIQPMVRGRYIILKKRPKEITISGFIYDRESLESLIAVNIYDRMSGRGAVSNNFGFYSLSLPPGKITLRPSYVGYATQTHSITAMRDTVIHFFLQPSPLLEEVVVEGNRNDLLFHAETGKISLSSSTLKEIPALLGESDVIKALQQMPGVAVGNDGMAGLYVRGGNGDENLYLVDGNPLYHVHHLLGLFSTFNPEAVKIMNFYKGSFPARYGGRLSSVVDMRMNDGDMKKFSGTASIGILSSRLNLQGPIIKDKTSFSLSFRRTYPDLIAHPVLHYNNQRSKRKRPDSYKEVDFSYYFYDFNAKINHKFSDRSRFYLSLYDGKDKLFFDEKRISRYKNDYPTHSYNPNNPNGKIQYHYKSKTEETSNIDIGWGNRMASLNWTYAVNSKLFSNATLVYNRYKSDISYSLENMESYTSKDYNDTEEKTETNSRFFNPTYRSGITDMGYRLDFDYAYANNHLIRFGTAFLQHYFMPEESRIFRQDKEGERIKNDTITYADNRVGVSELSLYAEDEMDLGRRMKINAGIHFSGFFVQRERYLSVQPRLSARYLLSEELSLKASYGKMSQYLHLLQSTYINTPNDLWVPITKNVKPLSSDQFSAGIYGRHRDFDLSAEAYYKRSVNQVEYKDGASLLTSNTNWEHRIAQGIGTAYGLELMARRSFRNTSGWVGYTLSWANRQFPNGEINQGKAYPAKYDNRHKINAVITHQFNARYGLNISWIYATGNRATLPIEEYADLDGIKRAYIHQRNNYKMPDYHRLDLSLNYYRHKRNGRMGIWNFSIYNAYAHHNSFVILPSKEKMPAQDGNQKRYYTAYQSYVFLPIIPSFSYTYKF